MAALDFYVPKSDAYYKAPDLANHPTIFEQMSEAIKFFTEQGKQARNGNDRLKSDIRAEKNELLELAKAYKQANKEEIRQNKRDHDDVALAKNKQDAEEFQRLEKQIKSSANYEQYNNRRTNQTIQEKTTAAIKDVKKFGVSNDPQNPIAQHAGPDLVNLDEQIDNNATSAHNQFQAAHYELERLRQPLRGEVLGNFSGNPLAVNLQTDLAGNHSTANLSVTLALEGSTLRGILVTNAVGNSWSLATYDANRNYLGNFNGKATSVTIECTLDANGNVTSGTMSFGIITEKGEQVGSTIYTVVEAALSPDRKAFIGKLAVNGFVLGTFDFERT